jgi:hypothetical protein
VTKLKFRAVQDGTGWLWDVFTEDGRVIARGIELSQLSAATTAMPVATRGVASLREAAADRALESRAGARPARAPE